MNELSFYDHTLDAGDAGFRRALVTEPSHPYVSAWWPPRHLIGHELTFTHEIRDLIDAIATGIDPVPSFRRWVAGAAGAGRRRAKRDDRQRLDRSGSSMTASVRREPLYTRGRFVPGPRAGPWVVAAGGRPN
jgi:hypothetical protein